MGKRIINMSVLPGEPLDGSGKVCIHFFIKDDGGPFVEPNVTCIGEDRMVTVKPTRGRLACDHKRTVAPVVRGNITTITCRTDDARAVTCLKCKKSAEYVKTMEQLTAAGAV